MDSYSKSDFTDSSSDVDDSSCARENDIIWPTAMCAAMKSTLNLNTPSKIFQIGSTSRNNGSFELSESTHDTQLEPAVGMVFHSEEAAYKFYNAYAKRKGFSIRKGHVSRKSDGTIRSRGFLCSNEGVREKHRTHITRKPRAIERTNCMARIEYKVENGSVWVVSRVILEHNHLLTIPSQAHMLRSQRKTLYAQNKIDNEMCFAGRENNWESNSQLGEMYNNDVNFFMKYHSNPLQTKRTRDLEKGDGQIILEFLKSKQLEDPSFFYAIQLDEMERLTNFFWLDMHSVADYNKFGDVILLDTTYRNDRCDLPFAPIIGINHHKQILVFGAALLLDETEETFIWLLKTFLHAMSGLQPRTILTDNCAALARAVEMVLPNTSHCLCLWQIFQNSLKYLSSVYNNQPNFQKEFKSFIYENGSEEGFLAGWNNLISRYNIAGNPWLQNLFANREKWAIIYNRDIFSASMLTMQWSECMTVFFKEYFFRRVPILEFMQHFDKSLAQVREKEVAEDFKSQHTKPVLLVDIPMLSEAAESYTRLIYVDFENEFKSQIACICELGELGTFRVSRPGEHWCWVVEFDPSDSTVTCSCKKFQRTGILCMHALKVLNNNNILYLPTQHILKRWTKFANELVVGSGGRESLSLCYGRICYKAVSYARKSTVSIDALENFENRLDKLISEIENMSNSSVYTAEQASQEGSLKGLHESCRKDGLLRINQKRKIRATSNPQVESNEHQSASGSKEKAGQTHAATHNQSVTEPSHLPYHNHKGPMLCYVPGPMQPGGFLKFTFFSSNSNQGCHGHSLQRSRNPVIASHVTDDTVRVPIPTRVGQTNDISNQRAQSCTARVAPLTQAHDNQQSNPVLQSRQQSISDSIGSQMNHGNDKGGLT